MANPPRSASTGLAFRRSRRLLAVDTARRLAPFVGQRSARRARKRVAIQGRRQKIAAACEAQLETAADVRRDDDRPSGRSSATDGTVSIEFNPGSLLASPAILKADTQSVGERVAASSTGRMGAFDFPRPDAALDPDRFHSRPRGDPAGNVGCAPSHSATTKIDRQGKFSCAHPRVDGVATQTRDCLHLADTHQAIEQRRQRGLDRRVGWSDFKVGQAMSGHGAALGGYDQRYPGPFVLVIQQTALFGKARIHAAEVPSCRPLISAIPASCPTASSCAPSVPVPCSRRLMPPHRAVAGRSDIRHDWGPDIPRHGASRG